MAIVHAPARVILTFNYDLLIEAAAEAAGVPYISLTIEDIDELQPIIAGTLPDVLTIVHLHGSVQHPPSIVLDSNSYHQHMTRVHTKNLFQALARMKTLLFLGLALDEEYFLVWLQELGLRSVRHVYVCPDATADGSHVCSLESGSLTGTTRDPSARSRAHRRFSQAAVAWPPSAGATQHDDRQAAGSLPLEALARAPSGRSWLHERFSNRYMTGVESPSSPCRDCQLAETPATVR